LSLVRHWLNACESTHAKCSSLINATPPKLPTRVLDIGSDPTSKIVLLEPHDLCARYICLSYCWGGATFLTTTRGNFEAHKNGIEFHHLPKTFQDLIVVARALHIQYIWIDALCIIQKDRSDWELESNKMAEIYHNSYLTVAVDNAKTPNDGCFSPPKQDLVVGPVMLRTTSHSPFLKEKLSYFPLLTRGWCYQERMLSTRVLHFNPQEISWECVEEHTCECGNAGEKMLEEVRKSHFHDYISLLKSDKNLNPHKLWRQMVFQYSALQLTNASDKLPALSGLAQYMQQQSKEEYLAGLWKSTLLFDMCWQRTSSSALPVSWRAPTWSWASVDGQISYGRNLCTSYASDVLMEEHAMVIEAVCTLESLSETGRVRTGFVKLSSILIPVQVEMKTRKIKLVSGEILWFVPDWRQEISTDEDYFIVPLVTAGYLYALVVKYFQGGPDMVRIGLAWLNVGWYPEEYSKVLAVFNQYRPLIVNII
jgi:hypothetical protein